MKKETIREDFEENFMSVNEFLKLCEKGGDVKVPDRFFKTAIILTESMCKPNMENESCIKYNFKLVCLKKRNK